MIEETEELSCPRCGAVLSRAVFPIEILWECPECESTWTPDELAAQIEPRRSKTPAPPASNFL
jgi:Zn-finger nucleic acid-binding protein